MAPIQCVTSNRDDMRLYDMVAGIIFCVALMPTLTSAASTVAPDLKSQAQSNYGKLPLSFETNQGQADAQVKFLAHGQGYVLFLTPTEAVLSMKKSQARARDSSFTKFSPSAFANFSSLPKEIGTVLRMQFIGANPAPQLLGEEALSGQVNYLVGNDPGRWLTGVPTYAKVAYEGVYSGVNLVFYGNQGQLEYDFVVAPGANPGQIKLAIKGANKIEINPAGELVLHTTSGELRVHKPVIYQEIGGARKSIKGGFVLKDSQTVSFQVAAYDTERPLIIDPVLVYSTYLGGSGFDWGNSIAVDQYGQAYVTGNTQSRNFPAMDAEQSFIDGGDFDAFVATLTADGTALRYLTYLGGSGFDWGNSIAVDQYGQAYVTGNTQSSDFPTMNALQSFIDGGGDAFVATLTADGSALRYSTYLGGSDADEGISIAVDQQGQAYVTGDTNSTDFPTLNALYPTLSGVSDAFVATLTVDGMALRYSTYFGGSDGDDVTGIAVDLRGQAYFVGRTNSTDFPTKNAVQPTFGGGLFDVFVATLTVDGLALRYSTYLGGENLDEGFAIAVDQQGQAYVTGDTNSNFPTKNALQPTFGGGTFDTFVAQFTADGALRYSTYLGGSGIDQGNGIAVDRRGQAYVSGQTGSPDFPTNNALQPTLSGGSDVFITKLTADGTALRYSTYLGGNGFDRSGGIAIDQHGRAYVTGRTDSSDFPTKNALQSTFGGGNFDAFVTKIGRDDRP